MYYTASLIIALVVTLLFVSKVAQMLLAKRFSIPWVSLASLTGVVSAFIVYLLLSIFVKGIDPMVMLIVSLSVMFIAFSAAFKYINKMSWSSAITTGVANIASLLIAVTAAVVLNGESFEETLSLVSKTTKDNTSLVKSVATGQRDLVMTQDESEIAINDGEEVITDTLQENEEYVEDDNIEPQVKEVDFLLPAAISELKQKEKKVYMEPKYHVISVGSIRSFVGKPIRILRSNGSVISGSLKNINGSNAIVAQRMSSGVATIPVSIAAIRKLEVYR